jgi:hypothetical protein
MRAQFAGGMWAKRPAHRQIIETQCLKISEDLWLFMPNDRWAVVAGHFCIKSQYSQTGLKPPYSGRCRNKGVQKKCSENAFLL